MRSAPLGHLIAVVISEEAFDKQMRKMHLAGLKSRYYTL